MKEPVVTKDENGMEVVTFQTWADFRENTKEADANLPPGLEHAIFPGRDFSLSIDDLTTLSRRCEEMGIGRVVVLEALP